MVLSRDLTRYEILWLSLMSWSTVRGVTSLSTWIRATCIGLEASSKEGTQKRLSQWTMVKD